MSNNNVQRTNDYRDGFRDGLDIGSLEVCCARATTGCAGFVVGVLSTLVFVGSVASLKPQAPTPEQINTPAATANQTGEKSQEE